MCVFGALTAGVISVVPQHNLADLVQNAVCLFEIPGLGLTTLVWRIPLE